MEKLRKHLIIPDCQVTPDTPTDHLTWIGKYIVEKKPDVIVQLGDFADMESLSSYDRGKLQFEGRRYNNDCEASADAMARLLEPIDSYNSNRRLNKKKVYKPSKHLTLGNHEHRIARACENQPEFDGLLSIDHLGYDEWKVHGFTEIVKIDGVAYSHYFYHPKSGRPYSGENILLRIKNIGFSFVHGHQQDYLVGTRPLNDGRMLRGLICGSCYLHDEKYRGPQGNAEWRGIFVLHEVKDGNYSLMEISLDFLCRRYEGMPLWEFMQQKYRKIFDESAWLKRLSQL